MLLIANNNDLVATRGSLTPAHRRVRNHLLPGVLLLLKAASRMHTADRLRLAGARTCSGSRSRRLGHLHIVTVRRAQFRCI